MQLAALLEHVHKQKLGALTEPFIYKKGTAQSMIFKKIEPKKKLLSKAQGWVREKDVFTSPFFFRSYLLHLNIFLILHFKKKKKKN